MEVLSDLQGTMYELRFLPCKCKIVCCAYKRETDMVFLTVLSIANIIHC